MTTPIHLRAEYWAVLTTDKKDRHYIPYDAGWQLICTSKECTEEVAHDIVENQTTANEIPVYWDYLNGGWIKTAVGSLATLLHSKGLDTNNNYAILKRN